MIPLIAIGMVVLFTGCGGTVVGNGRSPLDPKVPIGKGEKADAPPKGDPLSSSSWEHPLFDYLGSTCGSPFAEALGTYEDSKNQSRQFQIVAQGNDRQLRLGTHSYTYKLISNAQTPFGIEGSFPVNEQFCLSSSSTSESRTVTFVDGNQVSWYIDSEGQVELITVTATSTTGVDLSTTFRHVD